MHDLVFLATSGGGGSPEQINFFKKATIAGAAPGTLVAGRLSSLWRYDGSPAGAGSTPTTAAVPTNATDGSLKQTTPATSARKRLLSVVAQSIAAGSLVLYDRVSHQGGLSGTTTGAQTTNLPTSALTRHTSGVGVELYLEVYTQIGSTNTTVTASYTDDAGNTGNTTQSTSWGGTNLREQDRIVPLPLAAGDKGVRAVASVTNAASTLTAGGFGVTLGYPLITLSLPILGTARLWSAILTSGGPIDLGQNSDAALAFLWHPNGTTAPEIFGQLFLCEK